MSATGRGANRDPKDFYPTPWGSFEPLIPFLPRDQVIHDPCCGDGRLLSWAAKADLMTERGADLYPEIGYPCDQIDYLKDERHHDCITTNPPFSVAFPIVQHAKKHSDEMFFLLRLAFLESEERGDWLTANEPDALLVLKKRPSFVMSITCKSMVKDSETAPGAVITRKCGYNWILPIESKRPKVCRICLGTELAISTSDNAGYAWFYWGPRHRGFFHI